MPGPTLRTLHPPHSIHHPRKAPRHPAKRLGMRRRHPPTAPRKTHRDPPLQHNTPPAPMNTDDGEVHHTPPRQAAHAPAGGVGAASWLVGEVLLPELELAARRSSKRASTQLERLGGLERWSQTRSRQTRRARRGASSRKATPGATQAPRTRAETRAAARRRRRASRSLRPRPLPPPPAPPRSETVPRLRTRAASAERRGRRRWEYPETRGSRSAPRPAIWRRERRPRRHGGRARSRPDPRRCARRP
jgi:hypothetical protein